MPITKEEASDLESLHEEVIRTSLAHQNALFAMKAAIGKLENFVSKLTNSKEK